MDEQHTTLESARARIARLPDNAPARAIALEFLDELNSLVRNVSVITPGIAADMELQDLADAVCAELPARMTPGGALRWVRRASGMVARRLSTYSTADPSMSEHLRLSARRFRLLEGEAQAAAEDDRISERVAHVLTVAEDAADKAQDAAGIAGGASLSQHFATYASAELRLAEAFRVASVLCVLIGVGVAWLVPHTPSGNWTELAYRFAILVGIGALSAYFARQSGHHRRVYGWAKSLDVQLKSFPAFIDPISDEVRGDIYREFARRVLGSPPDRKDGSNSDEPLPVAQLVDAITALAKRSN